MGNIELPSMAKSSAVCYTVSHDDLIDFANAIIKKTQEAADIGDILFSSLGSFGTTGYDIDQKPDEKKKRKMGFHR